MKETESVQIVTLRGAKSAYHLNIGNTPLCQKRVLSFDFENVIKQKVSINMVQKTSLMHLDKTG